MSEATPPPAGGKPVPADKSVLDHRAARTRYRTSRRAVEYGLGIAALLIVAVITWLATSGEWRTLAARALTPSAPPPEAVSTSAIHAAGRYRVGVALAPEAPRVGANEIVIAVADDAGKPVAGAVVRAVGTMPAMGTMPTMYAPAELKETAPGRHRGMFELSMDGAWPLTVEIESPALGRASLSLDMATSRKGLKLTGATPAEGTAAPLPATEPGAGTLVVDEGRRQRIGLTVGTVERAPMQRTIRAVGRVAYDETRLRDVTLKFDAWIGELHANAVGIAVTKDRPLFTVYGPDLLIAQKDLLLARRSMRQGRRAAAGDGEGGAEADTVLVEASRQRLLLMDIAPELVRDIEAVARSRDYLPILAPVTGTVIEKNVVAGAAMKKGDRLLRIADLSRVWVKAQVYEADLPFLRRGMPAAIALTHLAGIERAATVTYIYPYLTGESRTGRIRLELDNADGALKPDMFADVRLIADLGSRLRVPDEAVLYAGDSRIVFVDLGGGRLQPRKVRTGARDGGFVEIVEGVAEGERIVTSANFLIASESRLKAAVKQW